MRAIRVFRFCVFEVICALVVLLCGTQTHAHAQTTPEPIAFEVAAIKPVDLSHGFDWNHFWVHVNPAGASY